MKIAEDLGQILVVLHTRGRPIIGADINHFYDYRDRLFLQPFFR